MKDYYNFQSTLILVMVFCASLLSFGKLNAQTCTADAGTLTADVTPVQQVGGSANISASPDMLPNIPTNYEVLYVLTTGPNLRIRQTGTSPMFTVFSTGTYTIHTLVAELSDATDSNFLDTSVIVPGTTTGGDVLDIITNNNLCASLDVAGAPIVVEDCTADAGTLTADATPVQLSGGTVTISATEATAPTVPTNYEVAYVLTSGPTLIIEQLGATPSFDVTVAGEYTIHTLVAELSDAMDPNYVDTSIIVPGTTTGGDVLGIITGAGICASLDVAGAPIDVIDTLSVDENELADSLNFYPNPVQNELTIKNSRGIQINTIELFDISGRRVKNILVNQNNTNMNINLSDLSNGVYIINIISDNGQLSKRLIKK